MPVIKAFDLAYGRLRSPDLDKEEEFLTDFGMVRADRTKTALYMRGTDAPHHIHVTELGEPRYVGIALHEVFAGEKSNVVGAFNRLDRGEEYVDHHAFFCIRGDKSGLNHLSYEAADIDDVMVGHEHLQGKGYQHMWGIGRHLIGSQLFDYWPDPWGRVHEHWADTDVLNALTPPNLIQRGEGTGGPWGQPIPQIFMGHASP